MAVAQILQVIHSNLQGTIGLSVDVRRMEITARASLPYDNRAPGFCFLGTF